MKPSAAQPYPRTLVTRDSLSTALRKIGIRSGDVLCVHTSMKSLGFVIGGARTIIDGLLDSVGEEGTLMMPTYSGDLSDPVEWAHPPVPPEWIETIQREMPAYDLFRTPTRRMGVVPELFRHLPDVVRSPHPQSSFAAFGPNAGALVGEHPLEYRFGPNSPLGHLVALSGKVLLLGAPYGTTSLFHCHLVALSGKVLLLGAPYGTTSLFHLTQHLVGGARRLRKRSPIIVEGRKEWAEYIDVVYLHDWFDDGMAMLIDKGFAHLGQVGEARTVLLSAPEAVEAVVEWRKRKGR